MPSQVRNMKVKKICDHCGASMMERKVTFSKLFLATLKRIYSQGKKAQEGVHISELHFTLSQTTVFQRLKYWGFILKCYEGDGDRDFGTWRITDRAIQFMRGELSIPKSLWIFRDEVARIDPDKTILITDVEPDYLTTKDYVRQQRPHVRDRDIQGSLI